MMTDQDKFERKYRYERDEHITNLLKCSLQYALRANEFNEETYFMEDVTAIIADYEMLILKLINELIQASLEVVKEFSEKYSTQ